MGHDGFLFFGLFLFCFCFVLFLKRKTCQHVFRLLGMMGERGKIDDAEVRENHWSVSWEEWGSGTWSWAVGLALGSSKDSSSITRARRQSTGGWSVGEMCRGHLWGYSADLAFITEAGDGRGDAGGLRREGIKSSPRKRREWWRKRTTAGQC